MPAIEATAISPAAPETGGVPDYQSAASQLPATLDGLFHQPHDSNVMERICNRLNTGDPHNPNNQGGLLREGMSFTLAQEATHLVGTLHFQDGEPLTFDYTDLFARIAQGNPVTQVDSIAIQSLYNSIVGEINALPQDPDLPLPKLTHLLHLTQSVVLLQGVMPLFPQLEIFYAKNISNIKSKLQLVLGRNEPVVAQELDKAKAELAKEKRLPSEAELETFRQEHTIEGTEVVPVGKQRELDILVFHDIEHEEILTIYSNQDNGHSLSTLLAWVCENDPAVNRYFPAVWFAKADLSQAVDPNVELLPFEDNLFKKVEPNGQIILHPYSQEGAPTVIVEQLLYEDGWDGQYEFTETNVSNLFDPEQQDATSGHKLVRDIGNEFRLFAMLADAQVRLGEYGLTQSYLDFSLRKDFWGKIIDVKFNQVGAVADAGQRDEKAKQSLFNNQIFAILPGDEDFLIQLELNLDNPMVNYEAYGLVMGFDHYLRQAVARPEVRNALGIGEITLKDMAINAKIITDAFDGKPAPEEFNKFMLTPAEYVAKRRQLEQTDETFFTEPRTDASQGVGVRNYVHLLKAGYGLTDIEVAKKIYDDLDLFILLDDAARLLKTAGVPSANTLAWVLDGLNQGGPMKVAIPQIEIETETDAIYLPPPINRFIEDLLISLVPADRLPPGTNREGNVRNVTAFVQNLQAQGVQVPEELIVLTGLKTQ